MAAESVRPIRKTREEIAAAYVSEPWWYDVRGFFILTFAYNSTLTSQMRFFGRHMKPKHLEVGCGTGTLLDLVLKWRRWKRLPRVHITGVDYAESMLAGAMRRFDGQEGFDFIHADAAELPLDDASFDSVCIANSVHCFPDVAGALRDIHRVLKPGGTLATNVLLYPSGIWPLRTIATAINNWGIRKGILYSPYHRDEFKALLLAAGFQLTEERTSGNCYEVLAVKPTATLAAHG